jgi:predicted Fe-S protein YdhL (DUF1289 family)
MFRRKSDAVPGRPDEGALSGPCDGTPAQPAGAADDPSGWVASPCTGVCVLRDGGVCTGCGRTLDEIARWTCMDDAQRRTALRAAEARRAAAT